MTAPSPSCLYECRVMHRRLSPKVHHFEYNIFLFSLDLDSLDETASRVPFFSHNRWNLYNFRDRDHLTLPGLENASLKENVLTWILQQPDPPDLPPDQAAIHIQYITLPRVLGYVFNPVSFFFLTDRASGAPLCAVVQVGNTFRELKPYLLRAPLPGQPAAYRLVTPKHFYVSPFSALDLHFDFKLKLPGDRLDIHIDDRSGPDGPQVLLSALTGNRRPLTTAHLLRLTVKFPFITLKVIFLIHWQALRLRLKKLPFHRKADNPHLQQDLHNPHR